MDVSVTIRYGYNGFFISGQVSYLIALFSKKFFQKIEISRVKNSILVRFCNSMQLFLPAIVAYFQQVHAGGQSAQIQAVLHIV